MYGIIDFCKTVCYNLLLEKTIKRQCITMTKTKAKTLSADIALIALFAALIAVCSWVSIPLTVPITLQTFAVFMAVGTLGMKKGTLSVLVYILLGAVGAPVFSGFRGGASVLIGTTGGYIVGFILSALLCGYIIDKFPQKIWVSALAMAAGLIVCYAFGTAWYVIAYARSSGAVGVGSVLMACVVPFILPDALKIAAAAILSQRIKKHIK